MAKRRRKIKRSAPPWKSAIGVSVGIHATIILCLVGFSWRYLMHSTPGTTIMLSAIITEDGTSGESLSAAPQHSPPLKVRGGGGSYVTPSHSITEEETGADNSTGTNGTGGSVSNGNGNGTGSGNPVLAEIRRRIESAKRYPAQARSMHQEGRVGIHFKIMPNGQVAEIHVSQSSGTPTLDAAAVQAVQRSAPLPYYAGAIEIPLNFHLK